MADTRSMSWSKSLYSCASALLLASLAACGGGQNEAESSMAPAPFARTAAPATSHSPVLAAKNTNAPSVRPLVGAWRSDCLALGDKSAQLAPQITALGFLSASKTSSATVTGTARIYSNSSTCIGPYTSTQLGGSLALSAVKTLASGERVAVGQMELRLQDLAVQQNLLAGKNTFHLAAKGQQLFLGDSLGKMNAEGYPATLSTDYAFWRQ